MDDLKEVRKVKRSYTKEYSEKPTLVLNLKNYPNVDLIVTHGDGKSWGCFIRLNERGFAHRFNLGRGNQITGFISKSPSFSYYKIKEVAVLYDNPMVVNLYTNIFQQVISPSIYRTAYSLKVHREICALLSINPVLFLNLNDSFLKDYTESEYSYSWRGHYHSTCWKELSAIPFIAKRGYYLDEINQNSQRTYDFRKPLIKDAFNMHPKYIRAAIKCNFSIRKVYELKEFGYSADEIVLYQKAFGEFDGVPKKYLSNKSIVKFFCSLWNSRFLLPYRDYLRLLDSLPAESRSEFPLTPLAEKITKWHDRIIDFSIRHRREIENLRNKILDENYKNGSYQLAKSFEFSDNKFSIIACKELSELSAEGHVLRHCVGSYVKSVSEGNEYILFLRKNDALNTPFFTVDVTPDRKVRQIHGFCNCNITDEIKPFIKKWAEKFKLDISNCSGVLCALR